MISRGFHLPLEMVDIFSKIMIYRNECITFQPLSFVKFFFSLILTLVFHLWCTVTASAIFLLYCGFLKSSSYSHNLLREALTKRDRRAHINLIFLLLFILMGVSNIKLKWKSFLGNDRKASCQIKCISFKFWGV